MAEITALFWDVGGVILSNAWDRPARQRAAAQFGFDWEDFEDCHELLVSSLEKGKLSLDEYLQRTLFDRPRPFSAEDFKNFMYLQSIPRAEVQPMLASLVRSGKYLMATINNECLELNLYRIQRFGLRRYFDIFFSSCFLGVRKPEAAIYRMAFDSTQRPYEQCVFIDDRPLNLEAVQGMGVHTIHFQSAEQLRRDLRVLGVEPEAREYSAANP